MSGYKFNYEEKVWGGEKLRLSPFFFRASRLFYALKALKNVKKGKLLDIGCGVGDFADAFSFYRKDLKLYAIDISSKAIKLAKKRNAKVQFKVADAQKLPYPDNYFDVVTVFDLIEHVQHPTKVIKEVYRVLKPGGIFHTFIPTESEMLSLEGPLIKLGWKAKEIYGGHPHHFSRREVLGWIENENFKILKVRWGEHFVNQIIEIVYFTFLSIRGKNAKSSVEGFLALSKQTFFIRLLKFLKSIIASLSFVETMSLFWFPGLGVHITCRKE